MLKHVSSGMQPYGHIGLLLIGVVCFTGCGRAAKPLPTTYPVHGKVSYSDGMPLTAGMVQFQPHADTSVTTVGTIRGDGTYRLVTLRDGVRADGAIVGPNRVIVSPPTAPEVTMARETNMQMGSQPVPIIYSTPYVVERRDNEFNLTVK